MRTDLKATVGGPLLDPFFSVAQSHSYERPLCCLNILCSCKFIAVWIRNAMASLAAPNKLPKEFSSMRDRATRASMIV